MPLESATYISGLNTANPVGATDTKATLDDHIRLLKSTIKATFPNVSGAVNASHTVLNYMVGVTSAVQTQFDAKAPIASPTLTGTPAAPTAADGTNTTQLATTAYVVTRVAAAAMSATTPVVAGDAGKVWNGNDGVTPVWSDALKASVMRWVDGTDTTKKLAFGLSGITTATTRTATWPDKDGTVAMTSDVGMILLATLTPTAAANVDFLTTFSATYDNYLIVGQGLLPSADDTLAVRLATGGAADAGSNYSEASGGATSLTSSYVTATGTVESTGTGACFVIHVTNANDATNIKQISVSSMAQSAATPSWEWTGRSQAYFAANTVSGVRFLWISGSNFTATGKIRIYGYKNS